MNLSSIAIMLYEGFKSFRIGYYTYNIIMHMGKEVKWLLKEGGGLYFNIPPESTSTQYISTPIINHLSTLVLPSHKWMYCASTITLPEAPSQSRTG